jgi:hypothetical protein
MNRRDFLSFVPAVAFGVSAYALAGDQRRFFSVARRQGRWWFVTPRGEPFFSIALNHIDATAYYRTTHDAIRRYDPHHLILGDRYEAGRPIADEVIEAALPFVDVLSFQHFAAPEKVAANLTHWHEKTGRPVLLADHAAVIRQADGSARHDGEGYTRMLETLRAHPGCVGYHLCGAYLRNETRKRALRDAAENPDAEAIEAITRANQRSQP